MKKLFVGLASVTLAVSAWGQSRVIADSLMETPIQNCLSAFEHREAVLIYEGNRSVNSGVEVNKVVVLLERQGRLQSGYYHLIHRMTVNEFSTVCELRPLY